MDNGSHSLDNGSHSLDNGSHSLDNGSHSLDIECRTLDNGSRTPDAGAFPCFGSGFQKAGSSKPSVPGGWYAYGPALIRHPWRSAPFGDIRVPKSWEWQKAKNFQAFLQSHRSREKLLHPVGIARRKGCLADVFGNAFWQGSHLA